jgi:hypothetical protein
MLPCDAAQSTAVFDEFVTCAVNWLVAPDDIVIDEGVTVIPTMSGGAVIVTVAEADLVGSATLVALTLAKVLALTTGAV